MVVLERNSRADRTFPGSPFRRALRPASLQRIRLRPSHQPLGLRRLRLLHRLP
jgi:hypothetical protein